METTTELRPKHRRRDNGDGYVSKRPNKNGLYVGALTLPRPPGAIKAPRRWVYGRTVTEVKVALRKLRKELDAKGPAAEGSGELLRDYLPRWLKALAESGAKPRTIESYQTSIDLCVIPHLGNVAVGAVTGYDAHRLFDRLREAGKSDYVRRYAFRVLRSALSYAVSLQAIPSNPFVGIRAPKVKAKESKRWTPAEANAFLAATTAHADHAAYVVAVDTGVRIGELLALHWPEVNLDAGTLRVAWNLVEIGGHIHGRFAPKTERSYRTIPLTPRAVAALRAQRARQAAAALAGGDGAANASPWVFPSTAGGPQYQTNLTRRFRKAVRHAGVPAVTFHGLRHTHGSILVEAGVDHAEAAARMGHTVAMFVNTYVHVSEDQSRKVAAKYAERMGAGI